MNVNESLTITEDIYLDVCGAEGGNIFLSETQGDEPSIRFPISDLGKVIAALVETQSQLLENVTEAAKCVNS